MNNLKLIMTNPLLSPYLEKIEQSSKPFIKIDAKYSDEKLPYTVSKFGGEPFISKDFEYPLGPNKEPLNLLVQVNFKEVSQLPDFPRDGLLQIFICNNDKDGVYGMDYEKKNSQKYFRVRYIESSKVNETDAIKNYPFPKIVDNESAVLRGNFKLSFKVEKEVVPVVDFRMIDALGKDPYELFEGEDIDILNEATNSESHKIGGYPCFTQTDPRINKKWQVYDTLLFQMISQYESKNKNAEITWGDMGIANFFINREKLLKLDFSDVLYNWDCA